MMLTFFLLLGFGDAESVGTPAPADPSFDAWDSEGLPEWMLEVEEREAWVYRGPSDDEILAAWEVAKDAYEDCLAKDASDEEFECEVLGMDLGANAFHQVWTAATEAIAAAAGELELLDMNRLTADMLKQQTGAGEEEFDPVAYVKDATKFLESYDQEHDLASARFTVAAAPSTDVVGSHSRRLLACHGCWPWELHKRGCWCDCDNKGYLHQGCSAFCPCAHGYGCQPGWHKCFHHPRRENEPCAAGHGCASPMWCEAGSHRCRMPGNVGQHCHATRPCKSGLSCQPGVHKCYNVPRLENQPCSAGFGCKSGLQCEAGSQKCRRPGDVGDGCHLTRPCKSGLSCQPGVQKCYNVPRRENQPCSLGFGCGSPLTCEAGSQRCKRPGEINDPCHATRPCKRGLNCEAGSHRCKAPGEINDPCHMTRPCKEGLNCEAGSQRCKPPGDVGDQCHLPTRPCKSHLTCQHMIDFGMSNYCRDPNGADEGQRCHEDDNCKSHLWCKGGSIFSMGHCSKCPSWCGMDGCHQCADDESAISCGKLDNIGDEIGCSLTFAGSQAVNFLECVVGGNEVLECGLDVAGQAATCIANPSGDNCEFRMGDCIAVTYEITYEKEWTAERSNDRRRLIGLKEPQTDYLKHGELVTVDRSLEAPEGAFRRLEASADATFKVGGGVTGTVKPIFTVNPVGGYANVGIEFEGSVDGFLEMEFNAEASAEVEQPLVSTPTVLFRKFFMAGYVPVLIELKAQPFFWGTVDAAASITAALNLKHSISANFEVALDFKNNGAADPSGGGSLDPVTLSLVADGSAEIEVTAYVGVRFSLEVNKVGVDFDIAAGVEGAANLEASVETGANVDFSQIKNPQPNFNGVDICVQGAADFATGIAYRSSVGFSIPNPKEAAVDACRTGMQVMDYNVVLNAAHCFMENIVDDSVDLDEKVKGLCDEVEKNIPSELDWDTSGLPTSIGTDWELIELASGDFEMTMVESGAGCEDEDDGSDENDSEEEDEDEEVAPTRRKCANEHGKCSCVGTVVYGRRYKPSSRNELAYEEMMKWKTVSKKVNGEIRCKNNIVGPDPLRGHQKQCICIED